MKKEAGGTGPHAPLPEPFLISIVLATYRRPHTLPRAVATLQSQLYRRWELIVIDNAGDGGYRFDDPRIRVQVHAEKASASHARNMGLRYATGDLVCFFDDDDEMLPGYLEAYAAAFRDHPRAKMARCAMLSPRGRENLCFATPLCCLRREHATPTWDGAGLNEDKRYFRGIVELHGWSETSGDIVIIPQALCQARKDPAGGLREGNP